MAFDSTQIRMPTKQSGTPARIRFIILILDIVTVILLSMTIGLIKCWAEAQYYDSSDWNNSIVFGVIGISLIWTCFLHVRPAFRNTPLHPGHYVAWELICWMFISGCTLPALLISPLLDTVGADIGGYYSSDPNDCKYGLSELTYNSRECPKEAFLTMLQLFAFCIALLISILHFVVFIFACRECEKYNKEKTCRNCKRRDNQKTTIHQIDSATTLDQMEKAREEV